MVDSAFDSKEFHFSRINIGCIMSYFGNDFLFSASMRNHGSYIVLKLTIHGLFSLLPEEGNN